MKELWIPESPTIPGLYAARVPALLGKIGEKGTAYATRDHNAALQFETEQDCGVWCFRWNAEARAQGYAGRFVPVAHGFG